MTRIGEVRQEQAAFHRLLLRMAGRLPDELIAEARRWLVADELVEIAQAVVFAALAARVAVTEAEAALLADTLTAAGEDVEALADLERSEADPQPLYGVAPVSPQVLAEHGDAVPYAVDLTQPYEGPGGLDETDAAAVAAMPSLAADAPARALWRTWRFPAMGTQWPPPRRVYLLQADHETALPALAAGLQDALTTAGEDNPQVEAFVDADGLPAYQRTALGFSALLWTASPGEAPAVARVFDTFEPGVGPGFEPDHPELDETEADQVARYLDEGVPLLITPDLAPDVVDPTREPAVPTAFRTDGRWIWSDAVSYYLRGYRLAPDPALLGEIRKNAYRSPEVDAVALHRALSVLYASAVGGVDATEESDVAHVVDEPVGDAGTEGAATAKSV